MVHFQDIEKAYANIKMDVNQTPLLSSALLDDMLGYRLLVKAEVLQKTGSFKLRGGVNKLVHLGAQAESGVVAFSSGNHAQAVAYATRMRGIASHLVMPRDAPQSKIERTRAFGGNVILYDRQKENREEIAQALCEDKKMPLIKPYDDQDIIAGQGTIGVEIAHQCAQMGLEAHYITIPAGGGGMAAGCCIALHHYFKQAKIFAVEPFHYNDMKQSLMDGKRRSFSNSNPAPSICDAVVTPMPGEQTFPILQEHLTDVVGIKDEDALQAMRVGMDMFRVIIEPGGALGLAAFLTGAVQPKNLNKDQVCVAVLSGGNVDNHIIMQALQSLKFSII